MTVPLMFVYGIIVKMDTSGAQKFRLLVPREIQMIGTESIDETGL